LENPGGAVMDMRSEEEILIGEKDFDSIFNYTAGIVRSKFLTEIRDNRKIVGTKCHHCEMVWVPARSTCIKCFSILKDFVEVSDIGTITTYSVINCSQPFYNAKPPFVFGIIELDGASTGLVHLIGEIDLEDLSTGMKVQAVFKEKRIGSILDIEYFKPVVY
jgi:uncharacterized OB-fold protein